MKKMLILVGSPRKNGNTRLLAQAFARGAAEGYEVELLSVTDYLIHPCVGCNSCFTREGNRCFQEDGMQQLYPKIAEANALILASPVYFYGISAQLKTLVDRLHTPLRNTFAVKKLGLLLVAGATLPEVFDAIRVQYRLVLNFFGLEDLGSVCVSGVRELGEIKDHPALEEAYRLGKQAAEKERRE